MVLTTCPLPHCTHSFRLAMLICIMLSHKKQKYLPYMVVIVDFCRYLKVPALPEAINLHTVIDVLKLQSQNLKEHFEFIAVRV